MVHRDFSHAFRLYIVTCSILIHCSIQFSTSSSSASSHRSSTPSCSSSDSSSKSNQNPAIEKHNYEFHIAPMQCYTNLSLRKMFNLLSPSSILWTEMEKVNDILVENIKEEEDAKKNDNNIMMYNQQSLRYAWSKRLGSPRDDHSHLILQLGCNNPIELKSCLKRTLPDYDTLKGININCGCPSIETGGASYYGASLMKDYELTGKLVQSIKEASDECYHERRRMDSDNNNRLEISVKCRAAVFDNVDELQPLTEKDYDHLHHYVSTISDAGATHVIIHARPAILSGLSPVKNRIIPALNYEFVEQIAADFPDMRVTLNGGIMGFDHLKGMVEQMDTNYVSSHMAGRWCLRRPLDLVHIESMILKEKCDHIPSAVTALEKYIDFALNELSIPSRKRDITTDDLCLPLNLVFEQLKEDFNYEDTYCDTSQPLLTHDEIDNLLDVLSSGIDEIQSVVKGSRGDRSSGATNLSFNQMSKCLKSVVGKKVINKWNRNRAEL